MLLVNKCVHIENWRSSNFIIKSCNTPKLPLHKTRSSADADNRLDAFSGQSRSTNMVPFHMLHIVSRRRA